MYVEDLNGNRLTYHYNGFLLTHITDGNGRALEFTYSFSSPGYPKISSVKAAAGSLTITYNYSYDSYDNLIRVEGPEGYSETYEYNDPHYIHNITAFIAAEGHRTEYHYVQDPSGISDVCDRVTDARGNQATYNYLFEIGLTTIIDARNRRSAYEYVKGKITRITDSNNGVTNYTYDESFIRDSAMDENGKGSGWVQDRFGTAYSLTNEEGRRATFSYHPDFHHVTSITDPKGRAWTYDYDTKGNLRHRYTPAPNGQGTSVVEKQYYSNGLFQKIIDPEGITAEYFYDTYGNVAKEKDGEGNYVEYAYDTLGRLTSSKYGDISGTDPVATTYNYDGLGRIIRKTYPDTSYEEYTYDRNSNLLTFRDANAHTTTYVYNELNQRIRVTDPENKVTEYGYDPFGNMTTLTRYINGNPVVTRNEYNDHYNRLTEVTDPTGEITIFTYENSPPLLGDSKNYTTLKKYKPDGTLLAIETRIFDNLYRIKQVKDGQDNITTYNYDEVGNLVSVVDQNGHATTYTYDPDVNVVLTATDPLNKTASYTYYKNGKLKTKTDANNTTTAYTYDLAGNLKTATYPDATNVQYAYNRYGKVSLMTDSQGITGYSYNNRTWLESVDYPETNDTISYAYDFVGNRTAMATPAGAFSYAYYNNNLQKTLTNPQSQTTTFIYDSANRLTKMTYPNSTSTEWSYYNNDRVNNLTVKDGSLTVLSSYHYDYSSLGKITTITDNLSNRYNFIYDDAGRLTHEDKTGSSSFSRNYVYDPSGNRTSETRDSVSITYTYNSANQITSRVNSAETITYSYDNNGNLIRQVIVSPQGEAISSYSYDFENRLVSVIPAPASSGSVIPANAGIQTLYTYSGDGRRTSSNTNGTIVEYIYDGLTPLIERDASDTTQAVYTKNPFSIGGIGGLISSIQPALPAAGHIPDVALDRGMVLDVIFNIYYYHDSNLGNVNQITDSSGAVVQTYDYDAFGNIVNQTGSTPNGGQALTEAYRYKTKEYSPETGLVFFGARYYNPLIGRFITKDPLGMADGPNQYLYCNNDPINIIDPYGLYWGESAVKWWLTESVLPGPYGQPVSEWGSKGPTGWGDPIGQTECAGGIWKWSERVAVWTSVAAVIAAGGLGAAEVAGLIDTAPQANNIIRIISKVGKWGYRIDKPELGKWIHQHFWRW
ncbi:MAG: hypothetical protein A3K16_06315 [Omnitrophica bacterium RIFCSPLOWO2_01_FULL_45_24]|nr:MAG: hypothetical protein A3K16_06315 [Omnitrophica bacterium RIFCSPLOWO2_01_FULL_45_24]